MISLLLAAVISGIFAIPAATPKTTASLTLATESPLAARVDIALAHDGTTLKNYDTDMTKKLHMIVISDDFSEFLHVHPTLARDGHFAIDLRVPKPGHYHIYADCVPHGIGKQVFRFDVAFGDAAASAPQLRPTGRVAKAGPYTVTLDSTNLAAGAMTMLTVRIAKGGKPARDLQPYLGAMAHAVFIETSDLAYVHVHPMPLSAMGGMSSMRGMSGMSTPSMFINSGGISPSR